MRLMYFAVAGALSASATLVGAAVWTQSSGSTANFFYSNGHDTNGLFGDPTVEPTGFTFTPENFIATSVNGSSANGLATDRLTVDITAKPASGGIKGLNFGELGDYSIFNGGGVFVQAYVLVQDLDSSATYTKLLTPTPSMPVIGAAGTAAAGEWTGKLSIDFGGKTAQHIRIVLNNILQAYSNVGGSALIQKKAVDDPTGNGPGIEIISVNNNVPEPTTIVALAGLGAIAVVRRKRS